MDYEVNGLSEARVEQGLPAGEGDLPYPKGFGALADAVQEVKGEVGRGLGEITHAVKALKVACVRQLNPYGI